MPRFFCDAPLQTGQTLSLPEAAARHVQVLRHQPGQTITLFNGLGGEWQATIDKMGRQDVVVTLQSHEPVEREATRAVHLAVGMPANERMDWLVEKATELGVAGIAPLHTAHSVLRLSGERAAKKQAHWQAIAASACEQCGRNRVPVVAPVQNLDAWLDKAQDTALRCVLSLAEGSRPLAEVLKDTAPARPVWFLSGPEGGLSAAEDTRARAAGFVPVSLGTRVLRAETAALAALVQAAG
jgi:16S rRNA (uracil1498-N3)-methyltransferase